MSATDGTAMVERIIQAFDDAYDVASGGGWADSGSSLFDWEPLAKAALAVVVDEIRRHPCAACEGTRSDCDDLADRLLGNDSPG